MSDESDHPDPTAESPDQERLSRRGLITAGGAMAAGAGLSGLVGASEANALSSRRLPVKPFKIDMPKSSLQELQVAIVRSAGKPGDAAKSAIMQAAFSDLVLANPDKVSLKGFTLDFGLDFGLSWPF